MTPQWKDVSEVRQTHQELAACLPGPPRGIDFCRKKYGLGSRNQDLRNQGLLKASKGEGALILGALGLFPCPPDHSLLPQAVPRKVNQQGRGRLWPSGRWPAGDSTCHGSVSALRLELHLLKDVCHLGAES